MKMMAGLAYKAQEVKVNAQPAALQRLLQLLPHPVAPLVLQGATETDKAAAALIDEMQGCGPRKAV
jgi:hypothetical protein